MDLAARRASVLFVVAALVLGVSAALAGSAARAQAATNNAGTFRAVTPARVLDTRRHSGGSRVPAGGTSHLLVTGRGGVPSSNVVAVLLSVVVTEATASGYVTAYADGSARPVTSNLNFRAGVTVSDHVTVRVGANGRVALYNGSGGSVELVADVYGYVLGQASAGSGSFVATSPTRLLDTRSAGTSPGAHGTVTVTVAGRAGIPAAGVGAVALTVAAVAPKAGGSVDVHPAGGRASSGPTVSFAAGVTTAGATVTQLGTGGAITLVNNSASSSAYVVDVAGYYVAGAAGPTGAFVPVTPVTLSVTSPIATRTAAAVDFANVHGYEPVYSRMALLLAVTVTSPTSGYLASGGSSSFTRPPGTSALFMNAKAAASGLVVAPSDNRYQVSTSLWNGSSSPATVHVSLLGYFVPDPGAGAVTGRLTDDATGAGLAGVEVQVFPPDPDEVIDEQQIFGVATTAADGTYTFSGLVPRHYAVCFDPSDAEGASADAVYGYECWDNQPYLSEEQSPNTVDVTAGVTTSGIDAALTSRPGGSISGSGGTTPVPVSSGVLHSGIDFVLPPA